MGFTIGDAVEALKQGNRVARAGWNGMFIYLNKGSKSEPMNAGELCEGIPCDRLFEQGHEGTTTRLPNINMRAASGSTVTGWLASQTDLLAEDWVILTRQD